MTVIQGADLFSGAGGFTTGAKRAASARGRTMRMVAINHWQLAVDSHKANHPDALHICRGVEDVSVRQLAPNGHLHLLLAAPECIHYTKARAGTARNDQSRSTPWVIPHFAGQLQVDHIIVENVPEFAHWCRLDPATGRPLRAEQGRIFNAWLEALRGYGYTVDWRLLDAADYGDATHRVRLIVQAVRSGKVTWPKPTHGPRLERYRTVRPLLNLDDYDQSVAAKWRTGRLRSHHTMERIHIGLERYGGEPFILRRRQHDNPPESDVRSVDEPMHTITANSDDMGLIIPRGRTLARVYHRPVRVQEFLRVHSMPDDYVLFGTNEQKVTQVGNAVPARLAAALAGHAMDRM